MRHGKSLRKFSRTWSHRKALLRNLATSFFKYEKFETTVEKAKELRPLVEKLITLGRNDTLAARRQAYGYLMDKAVVHKLFADIGPRCASRNGGYTRVVRTRVRPGDAAELAIIELVDKSGKTSSEKEKSPAKKAAPKKAAAKKEPAAKKAPAKKAAPKKKAAAE
jgi:large subunit ribosomal protein L17